MFYYFSVESAVAQLLEMAQTYGTVGAPDNRDENNDEDNNDDDNNDDDDDKNDNDASPSKEPEAGDGETPEGDEQPEKDQYEISGKEAAFKCHCKYFKGKPCYTRYEKPELMAYRGQYKALNKKELDIAILSKIQTGMHLSPLTCQKKKCHTERKKVRSDHYFHGDKICRDTFCFIHRISHNKLSVLMAHYRGSGICVRVMKREAAKEQAKAMMPKKAKRPRGKGKAGTQKPRKRKPKGAAANKQGNNKRQKTTGTTNNETDAASAVARHLDSLHQYVDIPIGQLPRMAADKRYMDVSRIPETSQQSQQHQMQQQAAAAVAAAAGAGTNRPDSGAQSLQTQHHGVWHLPRRPDMQHEGPYLLPL